MSKTEIKNDDLTLAVNNLANEFKRYNNSQRNGLILTGIVYAAIGGFYGFKIFKALKSNKSQDTKEEDSFEVIDLNDEDTLKSISKDEPTKDESIKEGQDNK